MPAADDNHADVLVIGAGASGGTVARRFAEAGLRVVCLEQGEWPDRADFPGATSEWELVAAKRWSSLPGVRANEADYPVDLTDSDLGVLNFNGVGGGTVLYNAQWPRMLPDDFRVRTVDGVADDWPLTYAELQPYYEEIDRQFGVSGLGGNPAYPPGADPPLPPLPIGEAGLRVARAHARLGWHWWPEPNAILSGDYEGRHRCVQRGTCGSGCNEGAKASTDLTHWPFVQAHGGQVVTGARVTRLVLVEGGLLRGAEWIVRAGRAHLQTADVTVCAANAIGTARLLLASAGAGHAAGLANGSGLVGRRLMLHPLLSVSGLFEDQLEGWQAHAGGLIQCLEFARSDAARGFVRGAKWALSSAGGPMKAVFAPPSPGGVWGDAHHAHVRARLGRSVSWAILVEDLPEESNRVELSTVACDSDGLPAPKLRYRVSENSARNMDFQAERATESLRAAGAWRVDVTYHAANGHFMGTARMGDDPETSVVDRWGISHQIPNLVIADGSVFVTAGAGNPTSTIGALALRAADHLLEIRRDMPVPSRRAPVGGFGGTQPASPSAAPVRVAVRASSAALTDPQRRRLVELADLLIPAFDDMPAAGRIVAARIDHVLSIRPDLAAPLVAALTDTGTPSHAALTALEDSDPRARRALCYVTAAAYYLDDDVRARLGYPGTAPRPVRALDFPAYLEEGLLDHLV
jgi:choline dehydrogenase-like flavoprotein